MVSWTGSGRSLTVLLARLVLGERMRSWQRVGLILAGAGLVLVTI